MPARASAGAAWRLVALDRGDIGIRVDRVLLRHLQDGRRLSRTRIQKWIDAGDVLVNGVPAPRAAWRIAPDDEVRVRLASPEARTRPAAEAMPLDVLYEDAELLAVNKPSGVVVHPSYKNTTGTLLNGVLEYARSWPAGSTPSLVGRLDKHTSGVVLVAKRPEIHAALQQAMDARRVDKDYLAVVWGKPSPARGTIDLALDRDPWDRRRITVTDRGGQPSVTRYERLAVTTRAASTASRGPVSPTGGASRGRASASSVEETTEAFSLVRCRLITGRTHQIRVHLAARGWPIVGDATYGRGDARTSGRLAAETARAFPRQALHAWRLVFPHPITGAVLSIVAPLPDDMRGLCATLGLRGRDIADCLNDRSIDC